MIIKINKNLHIIISFFLLVLCESIYFKSIKLTEKVEYFTFAFLIIGIFISFALSKDKLDNKIKKIIFLFFVMFFFSYGLLKQNLSVNTKFRLVLTMLVLSTITILADSYLTDIRIVRINSYFILVALFLTFLLALINGNPLLEISYENFLRVGFNGGIVYKNYFASTVLASFIGIYVYNMYQDGKIKRIDIFVMILEMFLILISSSRGAYFLCISFLIASKYSKIRKIILKQRIIIFCILLLIILFIGIAFFRNVALNSSTYLYRYRGLINYMKYSLGDWFHFWYGNAEMAYRNSNNSYVNNIRSVIGWDSSLELAYLDIIIKNGFIGTFGYVLIYLRYIINGFRKDWTSKTIIISLIIVLLISGFVETYINSLHAFFGVYCYLIISGIIGRKQRK